MATLTIRFINGDDFVAKAIDFVTDSLWDHTELQTDTGTWIGAHSDGGVQERAADYCKPSRERRYTLEVSSAQHDKVLAFARSAIGTRYDFGDIVGLFLHDRRINQKDRCICSMFVFEAMLAGGIAMLNALEGYAFLISPETLHLSPLFIGHCTYHSETKS